MDILGEVESLARTPFDELQAPYGLVKVVSPEEVLVERVLISVYPQSHPPAEDCARNPIGSLSNADLKFCTDHVLSISTDVHGKLLLG